MNYIKLYLTLVNKDDTGPTEKHHIIPKSIIKYGVLQNLLNINPDNKNNLVNISLRKHYLCHLLLTKILKQDKNCYTKMLYAFNFMASRYKRNSKIYNNTKLEYTKLLSQTMTGKPSRAKGKKWSIQSRLNKSKNHYLKNKTYEEVYGIDKAKKLKLARSICSSTRIVTEITKQKMKNRIFTPVHKARISSAKRGVKLNNYTKQKIHEYMSSDKHPSIAPIYYIFKHDDGRIIKARKVDMRRIYNCNSSALALLVRNIRPKHKGWHIIK